MLTIDQVIAEITGTTGQTEHCYVRGVFRWTRESTVRFELICRSGKCLDVDFMKSLIDYAYESGDTALIRIPVSFVNIFGLGQFVLTAADVAKKKEHVEMHNAPYLKNTTDTKKPEKVGNIRI